MKTFFEKIYQEKVFVTGHEEPASLSGPGSFPENVVHYLLFLKEFIENNTFEMKLGSYIVSNIKTVNEK